MNSQDLFADGTIDDVGQSTINYLKRHPVPVFSVIGVTVIAEAALYYYLGTTDIRWFFIPLILPIFAYASASRYLQHEFMQQFAAANGYEYAPAAGMEGLDGALFNIGHSKQAEDIVSGKFQGWPITLMSYRYVTGEGKSAVTHRYTVFELQFDSKMPDIMLEAVSHGFGSSLFTISSGRDLLRLEGDFNKYFRLSVPKTYEIEALQVFTPDVMANLVDRAKGRSLEIVNDHLFIYENKIVTTKKELYDLYQLAEYFGAKLQPVLARMKPSVEAMEQYVP